MSTIAINYWLYPDMMCIQLYIYREREAIFVGEVQSCHSEIVICDDESAKIVICDDHDGPQILLHRII
jgi:hypothetical protein